MEQDKYYLKKEIPYILECSTTTADVYVNANRLTKIKASENPEYATPHWNAYKHGVVNKGTSIPVDYWVEGYLIRPIKVGEYAAIDRRIRKSFSK